MKEDTRKKLNQILSSLLKLYHEVHEERILDAATALAVILEEEEESKDYVPTVPSDQPYSPWDWFAWLRKNKPMYKGPSDYPPGLTFTSYTTVPITCPCGKGSCEDCGKENKNERETVKSPSAD